MHPATLAGVLFLRRDALLRAFHSRWSLIIGAILVFSAGIARNYDGEDLLAQPWWLAAPFGASLVTSFLLWVCFAIWAKPIRFSDYFGFLGVYWLTAPLAWLYGVPYERFFTPVEAVNANAWTLMVVSLWRVLIVARLFEVLYGIHLVRTLMFTLAFGCVTVFVATLITPRPVLDIMGGMRLPPEDRALAGLAFTTGFFSLIGSVILGLAALTAIPKRPEQQRTPSPPPLTDAAQPPTRPTALLIAAAIAIIAWTPLLLVNQPLQRNRREAELAFKRADYAALITAVSRHQPRDYPPNWRLPGSHLPSYSCAEFLADLLPHIDTSTPSWVRERYLDMARDSVLFFAPYKDANEWAKWTLESPEMFDGYNADNPSKLVLRWLIDNDPTLTDEQREGLRKIKLPAPRTPASHPQPHP
ncbi:MAG: hypothetical protein QM783_19215 [Phycisphaerales bacterium]